MASVGRLEYTPRRSEGHTARETDGLLENDREGGEGENDGAGREEDGRGYFFERVAETMYNEDRERKTRQLVRAVAFVWAIVLCLSAGSITAFSLYTPQLVRHLHYTQFRVNGIAIAAALGMYLPVPLSGYLCDRYGPAPVSMLSGVLFSIGYLVAAFAYNSGPPSSPSFPDSKGWPYGVMVLAFVLIGMSTSAMYLSAVSTCAKNFGRGKNKGLALALPIAAFGLSGMWQSQVGAHLLHESGRPGTVDVFHFFLFLSGLLIAVGLLGGFLLRIVDEESMIDDAVEELERSGLLEDSELFRSVVRDRGYGTAATLTTPMREDVHAEIAERKHRDQEKKTLLLNEETRRFLSDKTMWLLAVGFCLVAGPGDAFINNLGAIIGTLYPAGTPDDVIPTNPAAHVSIVALTSTIARIATGTLTDILAPTAETGQHRRGPGSLAGSSASLPGAPIPPSSRGVSRMAFLLGFSLLSSAGQAVLASGVVQSHGERFWIVSALIGAGYGAVFSLVPIIISVVWGVENFGTNWGVVAMLPAVGSTVWGLVFAAVYQAGTRAAAALVAVAGDVWAARRAGGVHDGSGSVRSTDGNGAGDVLCHGLACYAPTFWAMAVSSWVACALWLFAWRGWKARGVVV